MVEFTVYYCVAFFFFKQKTAYEMRISDWSSDVCSSDLLRETARSDGVIVQRHLHFRLVPDMPTSIAGGRAGLPCRASFAQPPVDRHPARARRFAPFPRGGHART